MFLLIQILQIFVSKQVKVYQVFFLISWIFIRFPMKCEFKIANLNFVN